MSSLDNTTLVLVGPHALRDRPFLYPRDQIEKRASGIRIVEVDVFEKAHSMVACGGPNIATLSFPEFLEEDQLRQFEIIRNHELIKLMEQSENKGRLIFGVERGEKVDSLAIGEDRLAAIIRLENQFRLHFERINPLNEEAIRRMSKGRIMYYVRTDTRTGEQAWAHSTLDWQFLRTGHVKGLDQVDNPRHPDGRMDGVNQTYKTFGRLIPEKNHEDKCHLVWTGMDENNEAYVASFVCTRKSLEEPDQPIVGTWSGRSNDIHFKPSSGYMVITNWELGIGPTIETQKNTLFSLIEHVESFRKYHPGDGLIDPPKVWEWELATSVA